MSPTKTDDPVVTPFAAGDPVAPDRATADPHRRLRRSERREPAVPDVARRTETGQQTDRRHDVLRGHRISGPHQMAFHRQVRPVVRRRRHRRHPVRRRPELQHVGRRWRRSRPDPGSGRCRRTPTPVSRGFMVPQPYTYMGGDAGALSEVDIDWIMTQAPSKDTGAVDRHRRHRRQPRVLHPVRREPARQPRRPDGDHRHPGGGVGDRAVGHHRRRARRALDRRRRGWPGKPDGRTVRRDPGREGDGLRFRRHGETQRTVRRRLQNRRDRRPRPHRRRPRKARSRT